MGFLVGKCLGNAFPVELDFFQYNKCATWKMFHEYVVGVEMGVAGQLMDVEPLADEGEGRAFHQGRVGLVEVFVNLLAVGGGGFAFFLSGEMKNVGVSCFGMMVYAMNCCFACLHEVAEEQHFFALSVYRQYVHTFDVIELLRSQREVDHG